MCVCVKGRCILRESVHGNGGGEGKGRRGKKKTFGR